MKDILSKLFSAKTELLSYIKELKDFLLGLIVPALLFVSSLFIPVKTPFRIITATLLFLLLLIFFLFFCRLINVADNKEINNIKSNTYKYKYEPISLTKQDFIFLLKNIDSPETLYIKTTLNENHIFYIDFDIKGKNGPFINKKFYLDEIEIENVEQCIRNLEDLQIINNEAILIYEIFDHNKPDLLLKRINNIKNKTEVNLNE